MSNINAFKSFLWVLIIAISPVNVIAQKEKTPLPQRFNLTLAPHGYYGVVGAYHLKSGGNFIELGIAAGRHGDISLKILHAVSLTTEIGKTLNDKNLYGFTASYWGNYRTSGGLSMSYYSDFLSQRLLRFSPMIGIGYYGVNLGYQYDMYIIKPNFDFGGKHRIVLRVFLGIYRVHKWSYPDPF